MIIACGKEDIPSLQTIGRQTFIESFAEDNTKENMDHYLAQAFQFEKLEAEMEAEGSFFYLLYEGEAVAGYLKVNLLAENPVNQDQDSMELERIYVLQAYQGKGYGKQLMDKAIEIAREHRRAKIWLGVWEKNIKATKFYEHIGFQKLGHHFFHLGDERQKDYIMVLDLEQ